MADSSLRKDRLVKLRLYALAGVPEYWIVDLDNDLVHVHRHPSAGAYAEVTSHPRGETLACAAFPDVAVTTDLLLPPR